jgi:hypothetical protein
MYVPTTVDIRIHRKVSELKKTNFNRPGRLRLQTLDLWDREIESQQSIEW